MLSWFLPTVMASLIQATKLEIPPPVGKSCCALGLEASRAPVAAWLA